MSRVAVVRVEDLEESVHQALERAGGLSTLEKGDPVVVKPNACLGIAKRGVNTNPEVVRAVIHAVQQRGGIPLVGESAIHGTSTREALEKSGIAPVCRDEGIPLVDFDLCERESVVLHYKGQSLSTRAARVVLHSKVVSVPVMKTHAQTGVTLSLKNMKGCFPGEEKKRFHHWHLDKAIAAVNALIRPCWALIDGTTAMEGFGPVAGEPVDMGCVVSGEDLVAVDTVGRWLMGFSPEEVTHLRYASSLGLGTDDLEEIEIVGDTSVKREFRKPWIEACSFEGVSVVEGGACSGCVTECMGYLLQHREKLTSSGLVVVLGPRGAEQVKTRRRGGEVKVLAFGNCVKGLDTDLVVEGCPPLGYEIGEVLQL